MDYLENKEARRDKSLRTVSTILGLVLGICSLGLAGVALSAHDLGSLLHHAAYVAQAALLLALAARNERLWNKLSLLRKAQAEDR